MKIKNMIKKIKDFYRNHKEVIWFAAIGIFLGLALKQDLCPFLEADGFMILRYKFPEDLFINLFTIQATIAGLSLAVIALAAGIVDKEFYGVSVVDYITSKHNRIFNHKLLLIVDMLITAINYLAVSKNWFNVSIVLFLVSILISIKLISDVYLVFGGNDNMKKEIFNYIINNPSAQAVDTITLKAIKSIDQIDLYNVIDYCNLVNRLYPSSIESDSDNKLQDSIVKYYADLFNISVKNGNTRLSFILIEKLFFLYKQGDCNSSIWDRIKDSYYILFSKMSYQDFLDNANLINDFYIFLYRKHDDRYYALNRYYFNLYHSLIYDNKNIPDNKKEYIKERIFGTLLSRVINIEGPADDLHTAFSLYDFYKLLTFLIDENDTKYIEKIYIWRIKYKTNVESVGITFLFLSVYLYYTITRPEKILDDYTSLINEIKKVTRYLLYRNDFFKLVLKYFDYLLDVLEGFEHIEIGRLQSNTMRDAYLKCVSFIVISEGSRSVAGFVNGLSNDVVVELARIFVGKNTIKECFDIFLDNFMLGSYNLHKCTFKEFVNLLERKSKEIDKERVFEIDSKYNNQCISYMQEEHLKTEREIAAKFTVNTEIDKFSYKKERVFCYEFNTYRDDNLFNYDFSFIIEEFTEFIIDAIREYAKIKSIRWSETGNYIKLIDFSKTQNLEYDAFVFDRGLFWDLDDDGFKNYFGGLKVEQTANNIALLIDSSKFGIDIISVKIEEQRFTINDIPCEKITDDKYSYSDYHGIKHEYSRDELVELVNKERVKYRISSKVSFCFASNIIGVGVEDSFEN